MVLCEISNLTASPLLDFVLTWGVLTLLGGLSMALLSGSVFYLYYAHPTFERWQRKHNPAFPTARKVRLEIRQMLKSLLAATLVPAATLLLSQARFRHLGLAQAYCGLAPPEGMPVPWGLSPAAYLVVQFAIFWVASDFYEWGYHQIGHRFSWCWAVHRHHHVCACGRPAQCPGVGAPAGTSSTLPAPCFTCTCCPPSPFPPPAPSRCARSLQSQPLLRHLRCARARSCPRSLRAPWMPLCSRATLLHPPPCHTGRRVGRSARAHRAAHSAALHDALQH